MTLPFRLPLEICIPLLSFQVVLWPAGITSLRVVQYHSVFWHVPEGSDLGHSGGRFGLCMGAIGVYDLAMRVQEGYRV